MAAALVANQSAVALTTGEVIAATEAIAAATAAAAFVIASPGSCCVDKEIAWPFNYNKNKECWDGKCTIKSGFGKPVCASALTFGLTNLLFGWILSKYTPTKRYKWATKKLAEIQRKYLFNQEITQENIGQILKESGCEAQGLPLVCVFLELQNFDNQLNYMIDQLNRGIEDEGYSFLSKKMIELRDLLSHYLIPIRSSEAIIKAQPQWIEQWKIHEHKMIEREKMAHQAMQTHVIWHI
jgi:hypothetical protein